MIDVSSMHAEKSCVAQSCFGLSKQEIQFVLKFPGLNNTHKLVWILLAAIQAKSPDFARHLSCYQFARMLNMKEIKLWRILLQLEDMGLVEVNRSEYRKAAFKHKQSFLYLLQRFLFKSIQFLIKIFMHWFKFINMARYYQYLK